MDFDAKPALDYPIPDLVEILNRGFEGYFIPVRFDEAAFLNMIRKVVIANYLGKTWHVPALLPEELGKVYERAGFVREELSQWQMKLTI